MLWRGRWLIGHVLVLAFAGGFVALGFWQLGRHGEKQDKVRADRAAYAAPAPPLGENSAPETRVEVRGRFDTGAEVLLRGRSRGDAVGSDVLTPLRLADGSAVLVDRGFIRSGEAVDAPTDGTVTARGLVRTSRTLDPDDSVRVIDGRMSVPRVDIERLGADLPYRLRPVWIEAQFLSPAPASGAPLLPEPPPPTSVNHLQYALQWFGLAAVPLVGWPIVLTRVTRRRPRAAATAPATA